MFKQKITLATILLLVSHLLFAQKFNKSFGINVGGNFVTSAGSYYKTGIHIAAMGVFPVSSSRDAITAILDMNTFPDKRSYRELLKIVGIKAGYRFFPASKGQIYIHPNLGIGILSQGQGVGVGVGLGVGFLPKIGPGNRNVFTAYNYFMKGSSAGSVNLGIGYQFNL